MASFLSRSIITVGVAVGMPMLLNADLRNIISNYPEASPSTATDINSGSIKAMGFTMASQEYDLHEVTLTLSASPPSVVSENILDVALYTNDANNNPGIKLVAFDTSPLITSLGASYQVTLRPKAPPFNTFRLKRFTTYWLVVRSHGTEQHNWNASNPYKTPTGPATHAGARWNGGSGLLPTTPSSVLNSYSLKGRIRSTTALYLQDTATGQVGIASYKDFHFTNWRTFPQVVGSAWEVLAFGQFREVGASGFPLASAFLRNKSTGQLAFWHTNSENFVQFVNIPQTPPSVWQFKGVGTFGTSVEYPLYQNPDSGVVVVGAHNGFQITQWRIFPKVPNPAWEIVAVGRVTSDVNGSVLFRNKSTGQLAVWRTNGFDFTTWHVIPQVPSSAWEIVDIWHDPNHGVIFRHKSTREFALWRFNGAGTAFTTWYPFGKQPPTNYTYKGIGITQLD